MHSRKSGLSDPGLHSGHSVTSSRSTKCQEKSSVPQLANCRWVHPVYGDGSAGCVRGLMEDGRVRSRPQTGVSRHDTQQRFDYRCRFIGLGRFGRSSLGVSGAAIGLTGPSHSSGQGEASAAAPRPVTLTQPLGSHRAGLSRDHCSEQTRGRRDHERIQRQC
jgi:hypothetical protein